MKSSRKIAAAAGAAIVTCVAYSASDEHRRRQAQLTALSAYRIVNLLSTVGTICVDYGYQYSIRKQESTTLLERKEEQLLQIQSDMEKYNVELLNVSAEIKNHRSPSDETALKQKIIDTRDLMDRVTEEISDLLASTAHKRNATHTRNAIRLTKMCASNGGLYIKLGQHIAMLDYIVPEEYRQELTSLLGQTPQTSWESVRRVVKDELGDYPENLFDSFSPKPIASASLAQVHIAYKNGQKYAVKIQHEGLAESATVDTLVITKLVAAINNLFEDFNYKWLTKEMNRNIPLELDFQSEKHNILKTTELLKEYIQRGEVAVPHIEESLCSRRVLTMSFEEGCYITDKEQLQQLGLDRVKIGATIAKVFGELIFRHGFVHCDPHEANLLVRRNPQNGHQTQVVLLDHGLYRQLDDSFRRNYCRLWQGIALGNAVQIEHYCKNMHAGMLYTLLAAMITQRPWDDIVSADINRMKGRTARAADAVMLQAYTSRYLTRIIQLLNMVPSDMLLLFKTNDCLRHLDALLGAHTNSSAVAAQVVADVVLREELQLAGAVDSSSSGYWVHAAGAVTDYCSIQVRLLGYYCWSFWQQSWW